MKIATKKGYKVKTPSVGRKGDAGYDFFIPMFTDQFVYDFNSMNSGNYSTRIKEATSSIIIEAKSTAIIPTGIQVDIRAKGLKKILYGMMGVSPCLVAENRSGMATKSGITSMNSNSQYLFSFNEKCMSRVVDENYTGYIFTSIHNDSNNVALLEEGQKFVQYVKYLHSKTPIEVCQSINFKSERASAALGSSDLNGDSVLY